MRKASSWMVFLVAAGLVGLLFVGHLREDNPSPPASRQTHQTPIPSIPSLPVLKMTRDNADYVVVSANLKTTRLHLLWKTPEGQRVDMLKNAEKRFENLPEKFLFSTNAGIFDVKYNPLGLHVENGKTLVPLNLKTGGGNFFLKPNGVFFFDDAAGASIVESNRYSQLKPKPRLAVQSGPLLVSNNQIHPSLKPNKTSLYIRSAIAVKSPYEVLFVLSQQPVSLHAIAAFCKEDLKCPDALYFDGAISQFYFPGLTPSLQGHFAGILAVSERK